MASLALMIFAGCGGKKPFGPPTVNAATAAKAALEEFDTNKDGKISGDELVKCPALRPLASRHNGEVTPEALEEQIKDWQTRKRGRFTWNCEVYHNGAPMAGATVTLEPEKFMGKDARSGTAKTDEQGLAIPTEPIVTGEPAGVQPGFYHIRITKEGESIPAKYNTETTLGLGLLVDPTGLERLDLKY
jgi:hypothetical protein